MKSRQIVGFTIICCVASIGLTAQAGAQATASSYAILSAADVVKNRVNLFQVSATPSAGPESLGCMGDVGGTTDLMGRGNAAAPDTIAGRVIAAATSLEGLDCAGNPPGTTAICLGHNSSNNSNLYFYPFAGTGSSGGGSKGSSGGSSTSAS